jgi:hypothetical protein
MNGRVLLMRLSIRQSARGTEYLSGFLGLSRVVAFKGKEPDKFGNEQWEVFVAEPERDQAPRQTAERVPPPTRGQKAQDRSRAAGRGQRAGETEPFHDDSDLAVADLEGRR